MADVVRFVTNVDPGLRIWCGDHYVAFRHAEYRTRDEEEIEALRQDGRVEEVGRPAAPAAPQSPAPPQPPPIPGRGEGFERPWAVNLDTLEIHDRRMETGRCQLPADLAAAVEAGEWKLYMRLQDARRWNRGADGCRWCMESEHTD